MNEKKYLNEEKYQHTKNKISKLSLIILIIGIFLGLSLIVTGFIKKNEIDKEYTEENIQNQITKLTNELELEEENLRKIKEGLEEQIKPTVTEIKKLERVPFTGFTDDYYKRKDKIEELEDKIAPTQNQIKEIENYLDNSFCFNENLTAKACNLDSKIKKLQNMNPEFEKKFNSSKYIPLFMFGGFIIISTLMISGSIYMTTKRREILAFSAQQVMPIAKEGLEEMVPTMGKVAKEMAPVYKEVVKEVTKGIKEGLKDETNNEKEI